MRVPSSHLYIFDDAVIRTSSIILLLLLIAFYAKHFPLETDQQQLKEVSYSMKIASISIWQVRLSNALQCPVVFKSLVRLTQSSLSSNVCGFCLASCKHHHQQDYSQKSTNLTNVQTDICLNHSYNSYLLKATVCMPMFPLIF